MVKTISTEARRIRRGSPNIKINISIDLYLIYEEWLNCWNMTDILYKRLSDETIGAYIEVYKLMEPNLSEKI